MKEVGRLGRARAQLGIGDGDRLAVGVAVGDVANGDLAGIVRAALRNPVVQVPGKNPLVERHALERFDVLQRSKRHVCRPHLTSPRHYDQSYSTRSLAIPSAIATSSTPLCHTTLDAAPQTISNIETLFHYLKRCQTWTIEPLSLRTCLRSSCRRAAARRPERSISRCRFSSTSRIAASPPRWALSPRNSGSPRR